MAFVAGAGNFSASWELQEAAFRTQHQVLLLENRGMARSGSPGGLLWSVAGMADDVLAVLSSVGWDSAVHLVGHSMGAAIAYEVACRARPGQLASVTQIGACVTPRCPGCWCGVNGAPVPLEGVWRMCKLLLASDVAERVEANLRLNYPESFLQQQAFDGGVGTNREAVVRWLQRTLRGKGAVRQASMMRQLLAVILHQPAPLPSTAPPMLVIVGDQDISVHQASIRARADDIGASLLVIRGAGHNCFLQSATHVNSAIQAHVMASSVPLQERTVSMPPAACRETDVLLPM